MSPAHDLSAERSSTQDDQQPEQEAPIRPRELAHLLLAATSRPPRQRARDQQADLAGIELKRDVLVRLSALDPEPDQFDAALQTIITDIGPPYGPTRGICLNIRNDWEAACSSPDFIAWLLNEAVRASRGEQKRKRRAD